MTPAAESESSFADELAAAEGGAIVDVPLSREPAGHRSYQDAGLTTCAPILAIPPDEVQKICAGEVVERPLSVVKELIENALDAGARAVSVELEDGGRRLIRVSDDGGGIPADELPLALKPHHTSKLRSLDDLMRLSTLGFRGEALSSIAAVSKVTLSSFAVGVAPARPETKIEASTGLAGRAGATPTVGARIEVHGGALLSSEPCNIRAGSEVEVRELFYNVPARLKFLRSSASEAAQVSGLLTCYALAYPEVRWTLSSGGRTLLSSDGDGDLHAVLADLLGAELAADLAPIDFEYPPMAASGYISAPHRHWHNRTRQWFLINRRPVNNKLLYKAVDDAMREFVSAGKFPAGVFMLDLPPEEIDVNVHPAKTEVAFAQPEAVYSLLLTAVRRALGDAAATRQRKLTQGMSLVVSPVAREFREAVRQPEAVLEFPTTLAANETLLDDPELDAEAAQGERAVPVYDMERSFVVESTATEVRTAGAAPAAQSNIELDGPGEILQVMQVADTYLVLVTASEVYLIDQHSAHERALFEELWERINQGRLMRQMLLLPQSVELTPIELGMAELLLPELERLGFGAQLRGNSMEITEVPALLAAKITPELLASSLSEMAGVGKGNGGAGVPPVNHLLADETPAPPDSGASSLHNVIKNLTATMACKAAVKAGQRLPDSEREHLVRLICSRWSSLSCPHGRPTVVRLGPGELEKMFMRT